MNVDANLSYISFFLFLTTRMKRYIQKKLLNCYLKIDLSYLRVYRIFFITQISQGEY